MKATLVLPSSIILLEAALEGLVQANVVLIRAGKVPPSPLDSAVRYVRERSGFEEWNIASRVMRLGQGDCEDLAAWQAAGHIASGDDEGARVAIVRTGRRTYHAVCQLSSGEIEDVCPELGMETKGHSVPGDDSESTALVSQSSRSPDVVGAGFLDVLAKATEAAKAGASLPSKVKDQVRKEAKAGVTPIVMVAIGLSLFALMRR